ncbi:MAG: bifunctional diguanylate cyclase/phosphodiesterase [Actinomycetota bacterium]|nr:bifunctional diguanylate cyclase/phosphodiesterase [Actinomycetota bacterium]
MEGTMDSVGDERGGAQSGDLRDFSTAARAVLGLIQERLDFETAFISRRQGDQYVILDCLGGERSVQAGDVLAWSDTFCSLMMAGNGPTMAPRVDDVSAYRALKDRQNLPLQSVMSMPIYDGQGGLFGTLCGFSAVPKPPELLVEEPTVRLWADLLGLILAGELAVDQESYRAARAERAAETDPLTGLGNRGLWDRLVGLEEARCRRYGSSAAVVVVDLDRLKAINDDLGHAAGDAQLARAGACLRAMAPSGVRSARIGGDEFALLATEYDQSSGADLVNLLQRALADAGVDASLGLGVRNPDVDMIGAWRRADLEMYRAKRQVRSGAMARGRRAADTPRSAFTDRLARLITTSESATAQVDELLRLTREHLDSDVAIVTEIHDGRWTVRHVSSRQGGWERGYQRAAEETYCQGILAKSLPEVIPDTSAVVGGPSLDWLSAPVGSYLGVPLALNGNDDAGTLCCFSAGTDLSLNQRDASFLRLVARMISDLMAREEAVTSRQRLALRRVEAARDQGAIIMAFQPIVELATRRTVGLEALTRIPGMIEMSPVELYEAADQAGLTVETELFAANLAAVGFDATDGFVAVNFSATTLLDPGFERFLANVPLERTVIEISEHTRVEDYDAIDTILTPLRTRGLRLAVDDAGAGFASFRHILRLRPDIIKLDISLVRHVATDDVSRRLAAALAGVGQQIGAQVVAEGIEVEEAVTVLEELGVGFGQGYLLGRPEQLPVKAAD